MPSRIAKGSATIDFVYGLALGHDADHARVNETRKTGATFDSQTYFVNAGNALFFEIETKGAITEWKHYLHAPSGLLMMRSIKSNTTAKTDVYFHKDHLGSITTITNNIGATLEQNSFDAFGKRRNSNGSDATTTINSLTRRGFTEHEMLPEVNMIHMNGRVYEPTLGRFMSADPQGQFAGFSQSYNRYSYTLNNPLSGTDPTGFGTWSDFRDQILNPFSSTSPVNISNRDSVFNPAGRNSIWWGARGNLLGAMNGNLGQILMGTGHMMIPGLYSIDAFNSTHPTSARITTAAGQIACGFTTVFYAVCSAGVSAYSTAVMGGGNSSILKSAAAAYITASVGEYYGNTYSVERVFVTGIAGGIASEIQGGTFQDGFSVSFGMAALNYAARMMRSVMVDQSRINPNNATGVSAGSGGDGFKLAGTRCESMEACGTDGPLGGRQGGLGKFGPIQYSAGSIYDRVNEAYAGPHDWLSNKLFGFYDKNGNGVSWNFPGGSALQWAVSGALVVPATVLVIGSVIPESAYGSLTPLRRQ